MTSERFSAELAVLSKKLSPNLFRFLGQCASQGIRDAHAEDA